MQAKDVIFESGNRPSLGLVAAATALSAAIWLLLWIHVDSTWMGRFLCAPFLCMFVSGFMDQLGIGKGPLMHALFFAGLFMAAPVLGPMYLISLLLEKKSTEERHGDYHA